jgi:4-amino-4-deoxy-L-arabinose transferase-like glycosyltransferase
VACAAYKLAGRELLVVPRAVSAAFWVAGVVPLTLIGLRAMSPVAVLLAGALHLFVPYAIVASRSFQPDPFMTWCSLLALWMLIREHERRSAATFAAAAAATAFALVVKPMSVFLLVPAAIGLAIGRHGARRAPSDRRVLGLLAVSLLPPLLIYGYSTVFGTLARDQWQLRFVPALLDTRFFWAGWFDQVRRVFGVPLLVAGVAGVRLAAERWMRAFLAALWIGYVTFAIAFTYHMPTHDYYHLPFIPVAALGAGAAVDAVLRRAHSSWRGAMQTAVVALALVIAASGTLRAWPQLRAGDDERLRDYQAIGELCAHDTRVLFLDREYGYPLMYHAGIAGDAWPSADDLAAEALGGSKPIGASERFERDFAEYQPHYFVVTDLASFEAQPDLQELLRARAGEVASTASYRVYRFVPR